MMGKHDTPLSGEQFVLLLDMWDEVSAAIDRVVTALPGQMTDATAHLEVQREAMREVIRCVSREALSKAKEADGDQPS